MTVVGSATLSMLAACSGAAMTPERNETVSALATEVPTGSEVAASAANPSAEQLRPTGAPAPAPKAAPSQTTSRVLGKGERTLVDGKRVCEVRFVYAGRAPEEVFWEEPCGDVDARMVGRGDLEKLGRWERLDGFQQKFVGEMRDGQVLYIGGKLSASVYPVDETGTSIEVAVAD